jgi:Domain of unknown function (DUF6285)
MDDAPAGADLLKLVREVLRGVVIPALSDDARYQALMAANALAVVERELQAPATGGDLAAQEQEALLSAIRAGHYDADAALYEVLLTSTARTAWIWKPAAVTADEARRFGYSGTAK